MAPPTAQQASSRSCQFLFVWKFSAKRPLAPGRPALDLSPATSAKDRHAFARFSVAAFGRRNSSMIPSPLVTGLNHANISTMKLEATIAFFVDVLGLKVGP